MMLGERERPDGCLTDLTFDAWFAGELTPARVAAAEAHVARCDRCRRVHGEFAAEREVFFAARPVLELKPVPVAPRRQRVLLSLGAFAAAAAVAVVVVVAMNPVREQAEPVVRAKGGPSIGFFVERGGSSKRGTAGEVVHAGNRVRFAYTSEKPRYLAIYSMDSRGTASIFFPDGDRAERLPAGSDTILSSAVELDDAPGLETVFAVFCESEFPVERLRKLLAEQRSLEAPSGCSLDVLTWFKGRAN